MHPAQTLRRTFVLLALLTLFVMSFGSVAAQDENVLVIGHAESTDSLDPARGFTQTTGIIHKATYDTLVTFPEGDASEILPALATEWTISEDGLVYTFTLRDGVLFSNGDPMTAADVVFSFNRTKNIAGNPSFLAETIASVEAPDDATFVMTLTQPDPSILAKIIYGAFSVVNADQVMENGGTDTADDAAEGWLNSHSAGTGPYILESWESQVETVLARNPNYWGEAPYFDRVIITNIAEAATQKIALEAGDIDVALDLTRDQLPDLDGNPEIAALQVTGPIVHFLLMNEDPELGGPMSDPLVQRAVRLALDYPGYQALWGGETPASVIPVGFATAYGSDQAITRDLDAARALLEEAGYADGFETTLSYPTFTFQGVNMETNAQKIQADLAEIGITVTLNPQELQVSLQEYRDGVQGFGYWFWGPDYIDPGDYTVFLPERLVGLRARWMEADADPAAIELRDRAETTTDPDGRVAVFGEIQDYLQESGPWAPFIQPGVQVGYRSNIDGVVFHIQWLLDVALISRTDA